MSSVFHVKLKGLFEIYGDFHNSLETKSIFQYYNVTTVNGTGNKCSKLSLKQWLKSSWGKENNLYRGILVKNIYIL